MRNVRFEPWTDALGERLSKADIGLVTQKPETVGSVVPSKTYGLMAAGRPVLFIGPGEATPARVVRRFGCGWHFECGDVDGVARLLSELPERPEVMREAGERGRRAFEEFYCREAGVGRVMEVVLGSHE
jgi:glycosyltransferase involved in cell wall biosynthesis